MHNINCHSDFVPIGSRGYATNSVIVPNSTFIITHQDSLTWHDLRSTWDLSNHQPRGTLVLNHKIQYNIPPLFCYTWIWDLISKLNRGFPTYPIIIDGSMFEEDAKRVPTIKRGGTGRPYLESVIIHLENPRGTNSSKYLSLILRSVRW